MAKQNLDDADIDILLEQMRGKAMPLGVRTDALAKIGPLSRLLKRTVIDGFLSPSATSRQPKPRNATTPCLQSRSW